MRKDSLRSRRRTGKRIHPFTFVALEPRLLLCGAVDDDHGHEQVIGEPAIFETELPVATTAATADTSVAAAYALSSVPVLNSRLGAPATLYLDFNGAPAMTWGSYSVPATPAYTNDADTTTFTDAELTNIREIWSRVSEKYSPFNVNITTVAPPSLTDRVAMSDVIGGAGAWSGGTYGGLSYVGGFANSLPNISFIFSANLGAGDPRYVGEASSHESGHDFGLQHQSTYSGTTKTAEYNPGNSLIAPIMGNSYYAARGLWWYGTSSISSTSMQDDMAIISGSTNAFGSAPEDHGQSISAANPLTVSGTSLSGSGVISTTSDRDYFSFTTTRGSVTLSGNVLSVGPTLDLKLQLYNSAGTLLASADNSSLGETLSTSLSSGTYYLVVASHGSYGDVGQYTVSGTIGTTSTVAAPSNLTAAAVSGTQVNLTWTNNATNASSVLIERATGTGAFVQIASVAANVTSYSDSGLTAGTLYSYRVRATDLAGNYSPYSNTASVSTPSLVPTTVVLDNASPTGVTITGTWTATTGAPGYYGTNYTHDGNTGKGTKSVRFSPNLASGTYQVFFRAPAYSTAPWAFATNVPVDINSTSGTTTATVNEQINGGVWVLLGTFNMDANSNVLIRTGATNGYVIADAVEFVPYTAPAAPAALTAAAVSGTPVNLTWTNNAINANMPVDINSAGGTSAWSTVVYAATDSLPTTNSTTAEGKSAAMAKGTVVQILPSATFSTRPIQHSILDVLADPASSVLG